MFSGRRLRHRISIESVVETQDPVTGAISETWATFGTYWASIEPLSAKAFIASQAEQSKITTKIQIRYASGINSKMRIYHPVENRYYKIEGVLSDKTSGKHYLTLPCSVLEDV